MAPFLSLAVVLGILGWLTSSWWSFAGMVGALATAAWIATEDA